MNHPGGHSITRWSSRNFGSARVRGRVSSKLLGGKGCLRAPAVSVSILCPLGQPKKAIGFEPQIESWLAHSPRCLLAFPSSTALVFPFPSLPIISERSSPSRVRHAAPTGAWPRLSLAPLTALGRSEQRFQLGGKRRK